MFKIFLFYMIIFCLGNYVTKSLIIPLVYGIYNHLINLQPSTSEGKIILQKTVESVKTRLFNYEERTLPRLATILDPRLKKEAFRSSDYANCAVSLLQSEMSMKNHYYPKIQRKVMILQNRHLTLVNHYLIF